MIPLTIPEISRLLAARLLQPHPPGHATHWLNWRRRHQAAHAGTTSTHNSPETAESPWSASNWRLPSYQGLRAEGAGRPSARARSTASWRRGAPSVSERGRLGGRAGVAGREGWSAVSRTVRVV